MNYTFTTADQDTHQDTHIGIVSIALTAAVVMAWIGIALS
jgi:hypothetical protein